MEQDEDHWFEPEVHRLQGELISLAGGSDSETERCYRRALEQACGQGARLLELRTAVSLARLWRDRGRFAEARDLLAPIYGWFTEGFDTPDLKDAKTLLDELRE